MKTIRRNEWLVLGGGYFRHGGQDPPRKLAQRAHQVHPIRDLSAMSILPSPTINPDLLTVVDGTRKS